jgi:hypothetical protein
MRWLSLLVATMLIAASVPALALPYPEAEDAYARGDFATAFQIWLPLAEQGSARAQQMVGQMYERGEWVAQDSQAAAEWYAKAAEQHALDTGATSPATTAPAAPAAVSYLPAPRRVAAPAYYYYVPVRRFYWPAPSHHSHGHRH